MGNDLEVFLSVSDLSNHASIPLAILLSVSYVLGAGENLTKEEFLS